MKAVDLGQKLKIS